MLALKKTLKFLFFISISCSSLLATNKVVYGDDDRLDLSSAISFEALLAGSTAVQIGKTNLKETETGYLVSARTLADRGICKDERFADQPTAGRCSGFLVGEDLLVTAGHCIQSVSDCENYQWAFGYDDNISYDSTSTSFELEKSNVYSCSEIIERKLDPETKSDYALVRLNKKVTGHDPLNYRKEGKIKSDAPLVVMGYPTGLPLKIAGGAFVRTNYEYTYFTTNLDTFGGNSGSAVFSSVTGLVEGILVRGEADYEYDSDAGCKRVNVCEMDGCHGEDVTRITEIEYLKNL